MTQREALERLAKWLPPVKWAPDWPRARYEYLRMLSEQAAAHPGYDQDVLSCEQIARAARDQVHALIEMLEVE